MQTCLQLCRVLGNGCAARHTYISKYHMTRHRLLCRGATVYAASEAEYTKKPSRCKQVCRKHTYISKYHMTRQPSALPRRHSICGKRSEAEYTKKPARCKQVCRRHTYISKYHMTRHRLRSAEALQYMRQAKQSRISVRRSITPRFTLRFGSSNPCVRAKFGRPPPHTRRPTDRK